MFFSFRWKFIAYYKMMAGCFETRNNLHTVSNFLPRQHSALGCSAGSKVSRVPHCSSVLDFFLLMPLLKHTSSHWSYHSTSPRTLQHFLPAFFSEGIPPQQTFTRFSKPIFSIDRYFKLFMSFETTLGRNFYQNTSAAFEIFRICLNVPTTAYLLSCIKYFAVTTFSTSDSIIGFPPTTKTFWIFLFYIFLSRSWWQKTPIWIFSAFLQSKIFMWITEMYY